MSDAPADDETRRAAAPHHRRGRRRHGGARFNTAIAALMELNNRLTQVVQERERAARGRAGDGADARAAHAARRRGAVGAARRAERARVRRRSPRPTPRCSSTTTVEIPVQVNGKVRGRISVAADATRPSSRPRPGPTPRSPSCSPAPPCARSWWCPAGWSTSSSADAGTSSLGRLPPCTIAAASRHIRLLLRRVAVGARRTVGRPPVALPPCSASRARAGAPCPEVSPIAARWSARRPSRRREREFWDRQLDDDPRPPARGTAAPPRRRRRPARPRRRTGARLARPTRGSGSSCSSLVAVVAGVVWYRMGVGGASARRRPRRHVGDGRATTSCSHDVRRLPAHRHHRRGRPDRRCTWPGRSPPGGGRARAPGPGSSTRSRRWAARCADGDLDRLNLAAKVSDGQRVYVGQGRRRPIPARSAIRTATAVRRERCRHRGTPAAKVNLNTATQAQLEELPGIGPTFAQAIIAERQRRGGFTSVNDLRSVRGHRRQALRRARRPSSPCERRVPGRAARGARARWSRASSRVRRRGPGSRSRRWPSAAPAWPSRPVRRWPRRAGRDRDHGVRAARHGGDAAGAARARGVTPRGRGRAPTSTPVSSPRWSTIPTRRGSTPRVLVRVDSVEWPRRRRAPGAGRGVGRRRGSAAAAGGRATRSCCAAGSRRSRGSTRGGGGSTPSAPSTLPTCSAPRCSLRRSSAPPTLRARWCSRGSQHLDPTDRALLAGFLLGDTRGVPARAHRRVPRRRAHAPHRRLGGERGVRAGAVRARCCAGSALRGRLVGALVGPRAASAP